MFNIILNVTYQVKNHSKLVDNNEGFQVLGFKFLGSFPICKTLLAFKIEICSRVKSINSSVFELQSIINLLNLCPDHFS